MCCSAIYLQYMQYNVSIYCGGYNIESYIEWVIQEWYIYIKELDQQIVSMWRICWGILYIVVPPTICGTVWNRGSGRKTLSESIHSSGD